MSSFTKTMLVSTFALLVSLTALFASAEADLCEELLKHGIYDTSETALDSYSTKNLKQLVSASKTILYKELENDAKTAGISIFGLGAIRFGGHDANEKYLEWKAAFLSDIETSAEQRDHFRQVNKTISANLLAAIQKVCSQKSLIVGWIKPSADGVTFTIHLKYAPQTAQRATITGIEIVGNGMDRNRDLKRRAEELQSQIKEITAAESAFTPQRSRPEEVLTVVVPPRLEPSASRRSLIRWATRSNGSLA